jgi:hypothetical protein
LVPRATRSPSLGRGRASTADASGRWKLHLGRWIDSETVETLDLKERGGVITGTLEIPTTVVDAGRYDVRGMVVGKEIELLWTIKTAEGTAEQMAFDYSLKGTIDGDRMSGKSEMRTTFTPHTQVFARQNDVKLNDLTDDLWVANRQ